MSDIRFMRRAAALADSHPAAAALSLATLLFAVMRAYSWASQTPVLLARAEPDRRAVVFGQFVSSSVAVLAVSLTVLAILYALPPRSTVEELRSSDTWLALQELLLSVGLLSLITLVSAHVATAVDHGESGLEWLEQLMLAAGGAAVIALLAAGGVFAAVLFVSSGPPDPSEGRGALGTDPKLDVER